jgi:hypothetical protein
MQSRRTERGTPRSAAMADSCGVQGLPSCPCGGRTVHLEICVGPGRPGLLLEAAPGLGSPFAWGQEFVVRSLHQKAAEAASCPDHTTFCLWKQARRHCARCKCSGRGAACCGSRSQQRRLMCSQYSIYICVHACTSPPLRPQHCSGSLRGHPVPSRCPPHPTSIRRRCATDPPAYARVPAPRRGSQLGAEGRHAALGLAYLALAGGRGAKRTS